MNIQLQFLEYINTYFSPWTPECHSIPTNTIFTPLNPIFKLNPSWIFLHEYHKTSILRINIFLNVQLQLQLLECQLIQSSSLILTNSFWILLHKYHKILFSPWIFNYNAPGIYQHFPQTSHKNITQLQPSNLNPTNLTNSSLQYPPRNISTPPLLEHQKYPTKHLRTLLTNPPRHEHPEHHHIRATCQTSFPLLSIPVNIAKQEETRNISSPRFIHDNRRPFRGQILAGHPAMHYLARGRASQRGRKIDRRG